MELGARRVLIYGVSGSGKSTLAARLSEVTGLPWHPVDDLIWRPGWVEVPADEQRARFAAISTGDRWILDSVGGRWRDLVLPRTELIIALDYPRWLSLARLIRRTVVRVVRRDVICNGNRESLRIALSSDSIVVWHFQSFARKRRRIRAWAADPEGPRVLRFRRPKDLDRWVDSLAP